MNECPRVVQSSRYSSMERTKCAFTTFFAAGPSLIRHCLTLPWPVMKVSHSHAALLGDPSLKKEIISTATIALLVVHVASTSTGRTPTLR